MKKDRLLQHQLRRLDRLMLASAFDIHMESGKNWYYRFSDIYRGAICRSLARYKASL